MDTSFYSVNWDDFENRSVMNMLIEGRYKQKLEGQKTKGD